MLTAKDLFLQEKRLAQQATISNDNWRAPQVLPIKQKAKKTLDISARWWTQILKRFPKFKEWTKKAALELEHIREAVKKKKRKFYYRNPKLRTKVLAELERENYKTQNIINLLDAFTPTQTNQGIDHLLEEFIKFMKYHLENEPSRLQATKFIELKMIIERLQTQETNHFHLPTTVKWSRTQTMFEYYRNAIHKYLACHDGATMFPINFTNQEEWDIFNRLVTLVGLLLNIPFTLEFLCKFMEHIQPIIKERQEHCFIIMPAKMIKTLREICTLPFSVHKYKNPIMFFRGNTFDIHSVCPIPIVIVAMNVKNWSFEMDNDILGAFENQIPQMPPQPHLRDAAHMASKDQIKELKTVIKNLPKQVSAKHEAIRQNAVNIENAFETELQWNAFVTNKKRADNKPLTMDDYCSKLTTKPYYPKHEKITLTDYLSSERNTAQLEAQRHLKCYSCHKYGHRSRDCIYRLPEFEEYNISCPVLQATYNFITELNQIKPLKGQMSEKIITQIQRPLLWIISDIFWSNLSDYLTERNLKIEVFFDYYEKIRRRTAFGAGRQFALGATKKSLIRMIFGILMPYPEVFQPYEYEPTISIEDEKEVLVVIEEKIERGFIAIGRREQAKAMLSFRVVKESTKNRLIVRTFEYNDQATAPKIRMITPATMKALRNEELMLIVDLDSSYDYIPIAETSIARQGIYLPHSKKMLFLLGGLTGHNLLPAIHEITQAEWLFNCANNISAKNPYMDDFLGAQKLHPTLTFKLFFENLNESYLAISPKLKYNMSNTQTFLGKTYNTITKEYLPAEKHYISLIERIYTLVFSSKIITMGELFKIRGKILSMVDNPLDIDTTSVDRVISEAILTENVYFTERYQEFLHFELSITKDIMNFILTALQTLSNFTKTMETNKTRNDQDKIFIITDAGERAGAGLLIYHSSKPLPPEIKTFLSPSVVVFNEEKRKIVDTSSTSREQNVLCAFLIDLKPFFDLLKKKNLKPLVFILGDNKGVISRIKSGKTKNLAENLELKEIKEILKEFSVQAKWIPRTHDLIQFVDEIPRNRMPAFLPEKKILEKIMKHAHITKLIPFVNDEVMRVLNPHTTLYVLNPTNLQEQEAFIFSVNPRTTSSKAVRNLILYIQKFEIKAVLISPLNKKTQFNTLTEFSELEFEYGSWNFNPTDTRDKKWIKANRHLVAVAKFLQFPKTTYSAETLHRVRTATN